MDDARPRVTVAGYLSLDTIVCPYGTFEDVPGGAALYAALGAREAGARVRLRAALCEDFPASLARCPRLGRHRSRRARARPRHDAARPPRGSRGEPHAGDPACIAPSPRSRVVGADPGSRTHAVPEPRRCGGRHRDAGRLPRAPRRDSVRARRPGRRRHERGLRGRRGGSPPRRPAAARPLRPEPRGGSPPPSRARRRGGAAGARRPLSPGRPEAGTRRNVVVLGRPSGVPRAEPCAGNRGLDRSGRCRRRRPRGRARPGRFRLPEILREASAIAACAAGMVGPLGLGIDLDLERGRGSEPEAHAGKAPILATRASR